MAEGENLDVEVASGFWRWTRRLRRKRTMLYKRARSMGWDHGEQGRPLTRYLHKPSLVDPRYRQ